MAYVITRLCRDCIDGSCMDVCPKDCILEHRPADGRPSELPRQLFIDPAECIDCWACLPECPWEAIYPDHEVPEAFKDDIALNARASIDSPDFHVPVERLRRQATPEAVDENKRKWGILT
jgi:ferredoxin